MRSEPLRLSRTFANRGVEAVVSPIGASLQALEVRGLPLVWGDPSGPAASSGAVLVPWPNRVRGGRWSLNGRMQQLERSEPAAGNALHGLVATTCFAVVTRDPGSVTLATTVRHPPGYPFELDVIVSFRLVPTGIRSAIVVVNRSARRAPVAVGVHPYFRVGDARADDLQVRIDAERTLLLGADNLPRTEVQVAGSSFDLRAPTALVDAPAHAAYTDLRADEGKIRMLLVDGRSRDGVEVRAEERFRWAQLYATDDLPGLRTGQPAVALEPMTAPPDALNSGRDLRWMAPSSRWQLTWGADRLAE